MPFVWHWRVFALPQWFNLLLEVFKLCFKLRLLGFHLVVEIFFWGEFLLKGFDALSCLIVSVSTPRKFPMGLIHSVVLNVGHNLWPCHPEQKFNPVRWYFYHWVFAAAIACAAYVSQVVHTSLWVVVTNLGIPWNFQVCSCGLSLNNFEAPFSWEDLWSSETSISGHCGNRSVMWSHLMEVVWFKPRWCLFKHLCSHIFVHFCNSMSYLIVTWWLWLIYLHTLWQVLGAFYTP